MMEIVCPFCGGKVIVPERDYYVMHSLPPCQPYLLLEVTDFLHAVNEKLGNKPPGGRPSDN